MGVRTGSAVATIVLTFLTFAPTALGQSTATVPPSTTVAPSVADLAGAAVEGTYQTVLTATEKQGLVGGDPLGEPKTVSTPLVLKAAGNASYIFAYANPTYTYTRNGSSLLVSGSAQTDCFNADASVSSSQSIDTTVTVNLDITNAVFVAGLWQATELGGTGEIVHHSSTDPKCNHLGLERFTLQAFRLDVPAPDVAALVPSAGALSGTAQAGTVAAVADGGATASLAIVIDPARADSSAKRSATARITVTGAWHTANTVAPVPGATLMAAGPTGISLVCGSAGPVLLDGLAPSSFSLVFADTSKYPDATSVAIPLGDTQLTAAVPSSTSGPLFQLAVTPTAPYRATASVAGCTSTIVYDLQGSFVLPADARPGTYQVMPVGIAIPYVAADGATISLPFTASNLPRLEILSPALATTTIAATTTTTAPPATDAPLVTVAALVSQGGSGDGSLVAPIAAGIGAVALVGAGAFFVRSRKKPGRLASTPTEHQVPPPAPYPTVRAFAGKGVHKVTSSGRGVVVGVRVVSREPSSTQISLTGEHGDQ